jgi:hypothetical protein
MDNLPDNWWQRLRKDPNFWMVVIILSFFLVGYVLLSWFVSVIGR